MQSFLMFVPQLFDCRSRKPAVLVEFSCEQHLACGVTPFIPQELTNRHPKATLASGENGGWKAVGECFAQDVFLSSSMQFEGQWQCGGELHEFAIEEWISHFKGCGHRSSIDFGKNVVLQVEAKICLKALFHLILRGKRQIEEA